MEGKGKKEERGKEKQKAGRHPPKKQEENLGKYHGSERDHQVPKVHQAPDP